MTQGPIVTKLVIDGVDMPIADQSGELAEDQSVAEVLEMMATLEEIERPNYILSTSVTHR